jgi:hypothetical protein
MIGIRVLSTALAVLVIIPLVGAGGPEPSAALAARQLVLERADAADAALHALEEAVAPGLDAARRGSARVVSGDDPPGAELRAAAAALASADGVAGEARQAVDALEGARRLVQGGTVIDLDVARGEIGSIAAQIRGTAGAADAFADMRRRAERLVVELEEALAALEAGSLGKARDLVAVARDDHEVLAAWEVELLTLPVWIDPTDAMIGTVETIIAASEAGDEASASEAAREFVALAEEAGPADRALRIALGEGGSAVTAAPLGRLADLLREVALTRLEVASIVQAVGR